MSRATAPRRARQHRATLRQLDRRALERAGWRTTLELRENHVRALDGELLGIDTVWVAEAERQGIGGAEVIGACGRSESRAWARLLDIARDLDAGPAPGRDPVPPRMRLHAAG